LEQAMMNNPLIQLDPEKKHLFQVIQRRGPIARADLLSLLQTNVATLSRMMRPLLEARLIAEVGIGESTGGRKPVLYDINPRDFYVAGLDISRPYTQVVLANLKMEPLAREQFEMDESCTPEKTTRLIGEAVRRLAGQLGIADEQLIGAGLGTAGPLDPERGLMLHPRNFKAPGWTEVPIQTMLEQVLGVTVAVDLGAAAAVLAENLFGLGRDHRNMAFFHCSGGIRTGATAAGRIVRGIRGAEDAFGHMVIAVDGEPCNCGNFGCIEAYASIIAIVKKFVAGLKLGRTSMVVKPLTAIRYTDICNVAAKGDALAREVLSNAACYFGTGLANYIKLLNPGLVILSGPLVSHSELFYTTAVRVALEKLNLDERQQVVFSKGGYFGDQAIAMGAAALWIERQLQ
jgi:predicted NBD/HSP70 family sugar kinase